MTQATTSEGYIEGLPAARSCVRFRRFDGLALDVIGETIEANRDAFLARYVGVRGSSRRARSMGR